MMVTFSAVIAQFGQQGEKTGWTYVPVPSTIAEKINPDNRKTFRVKGWLDDYEYSGISLVPMGGGDYIMALNATIRKALRKSKGSRVLVKMQVDEQPVQTQPELIECLADEPRALEAFNRLTMSHRNYFIKWIASAKTSGTIAKRIAMTVNALARGMNFAEMLREHKGNK